MLTWDELESIVALLEGPMPKIWVLDQAIFLAHPYSLFIPKLINNNGRVTDKA